MSNAFLGSGLDLYYKNLLPNASVQLPVYTAATDHSTSASRLVLAVSYSLKQIEYLLR